MRVTIGSRTAPRPAPAGELRAFGTLEEWREVRRCAYRRSVALLGDPACFTDPLKRAAFVAARLQYQDATFALYEQGEPMESIESTPSPGESPLCPRMDR